MPEFDYNRPNEVKSSNQNKPWQIRIRHKEDFITIEVTDPPLMWKDYFDLYISLLAQIFQGYQLVAISQLVDERQWWKEIGERQDYVETLCHRFPVQAVATASYETLEPPRQTKPSFVVHVLGPPNRALLQELLAFGIDDLPNIAYGLIKPREPSIQRIIEWNRAFLTWFNLETSDAVLADLLTQVNLLVWTEDGHIWFAVSLTSDLQRVIASAEGLAQKWQLNPSFESFP